MAVFLVMRWWIPSSEGSQSESDILNEPVSITLFAWQAGLALCLAYLATTEFMLRVIIAALPGLALGLLIGIPFGNTGPGFVLAGGLGFGLYFIIYFNIRNSTWIGIKCSNCFRRGTLKREIVKKYLLDLKILKTIMEILKMLKSIEKQFASVAYRVVISPTRPRLEPLTGCLTNLSELFSFGVCKRI
ncbi:MAG: hypothetical protein FJ261_05910 [Planctomycetes bacterium]|nr:hypothetical protein [Planctomycetota bacterium]